MWWCKGGNILELVFENQPAVISVSKNDETVFDVAKLRRTQDKKPQPSLRWSVLP